MSRARGVGTPAGAAVLRPPRSGLARHVHWLLPLLLAAACDAPSVPARAGAYPFTLPTAEPGLVLHWPVGSTVRVYVAGTAAFPAAPLAAAFLTGAATWNAAAPYGEFHLSETPDSTAADVLLTWSAGTLPVETAQCLPSLQGLGVTTFCLGEDSTRLALFPLRGSGSAGRVKMVVTVTAGLQAAELQRIVTHELGHVLGIARHSPNEQDVMAASAPATSLSPNDLATLLALYHTPADVVP